MVGEPVAANQNRRVTVEAALADFDEALVTGSARSGSYIAEDFVAARMPHGLLFGELSGVFILAHRRVIGSHFADGAVPNQIQARIAYMADGDLAVFHHRERQHAGHAA